MNAAIFFVILYIRTENSVKKGFIKESRIRVGDVYKNNVGDEFEVIEYLSSSVKHGGVRIMFKKTGSVRICNGSALLRGEVKDLMKPSVCGVGCIGSGQYSASSDGVKPAYYLHWHNMIKRCYEGKNKHAIPYADCTVAAPWLNLQIFSKWCTSQPLYDKIIHGRGMALDKDLLIPNNRVYSEDACLMLPEEINGALVGKHNASKKDGLPCGVYKHGNKYITSTTEEKNFDRFSTVELAIADYRKKKQKRVVELLYKYEEYLDEKTISALQRFDVLDREMYN